MYKNYNHNKYIEENKRVTNKFPIGTWLSTSYHEYPVLVTKSNYNTYNKYLFPEYAELWKPEKGDWVWVTSYGSNLLLEKFLYMSGKYFRTVDQNNIQSEWKWCEPFIKSLPTPYKDLKGLE